MVLSAQLVDTHRQTSSEDDEYGDSPKHRRTRCGLFVVISGAVSIAPVHADPVYDQKFLDYFDAKGVPYKNRRTSFGSPSSSASIPRATAGRPGRPGTTLMKDEGWTEKEATTFIQAAVPTYCPNAWG
jgi:hypothetical protein